MLDPVLNTANLSRDDLLRMRHNEAGCFNDLPAHVWPRSAQRLDDGTVTIAGVPLPDIAAEYGTPVMVVDEDDFRSRCRDMVRAYGKPENVHYASKAFLTTHIARWVNEEGLSLDVASENELLIALHAGFPAERITVHGNNKPDSFLRRCVREGVGEVVIDSHQELEELERIAGEEGTVQEVFIRVKPGVEAHTHEFIATSHEDQKFGLSLVSGSAYRAAVAASEADNIQLTGLHCHVGSQVFDAEGFKLAAERVLGLYAEIWKTQGVALGYLDLGGGYGIAYMPGESPLDVNAVAHDLLTAVQEVADELVDRYGEVPEPVQNLLEVARFRVAARAAGLTDVAAQGNMVRFAPADLPESRQMRLTRLYPGAQVKAVPGTDTFQVLIPKPKTERIGGKDLVDGAVLAWARGVVEAVFAKEPATA